MIDTPVDASPARMARWIGAAPRQRGSSEAWTLTQPRARHLEDVARQDQAVGRHDDHVGLQVAVELLDDGRVPQRRGLEDLEPSSAARLLDGDGERRAAPARRPRPGG